jgi:Transcriptional regulators
MVKQLLDSFHLAKKVLQTLPPLPDGVVPRHVHVLDSIKQLAAEKDTVYVSDVSAVMNSTTPSVTKLLAELESHGYVLKQSVPGDKRYVAISLSAKGQEFHAVYVECYHRMIAKAMHDITDDDCRTAIRVVNAMHERIQTVTNGFSERIVSK